ncbi:MAG TPA: uroporphyrinogen decarboxylase family protein, partial [Prolixibacteraceae bacterium]|nr:uroporphyrinogen decarboxylase family protein [Prolixibacteraceae bacterium]
MKGFELIKATMQLRETERAPWVPFVGIHGAYLIGTDATKYLTSADQMVEGISKAVEMYHPDGIPVVFDLQLEAEILGCKLRWSPGSPPAVVSHPLAEGFPLSQLTMPGVTDGRIPLVLETTSVLRGRFPELALYGLITGPFTLALHLLGTDIFLKLYESPAEVEQLMEFCTNVGITMSEYLMDAGCDVIAVVDPMTSQIDPDTFQQFVTPYATRIFNFIRQKQKLSSFFV